ncbi:general secretion pathway protein E [Synechococcus sp. 63AY4M2]|jgi:type IV pilus assembly protein PilB|uniref:GspE/PulE family protein n=1 Tax=unclassified Synechococcus TaxID=2626047 RepID=UPI000C686917|nr:MULTISPECIES: GspE/PulE family protein [unclassified Synechococcus]PIK86991.1 general secretion pathway protein E [Synechococcus sp. 63AY4M2]PIK87909.1 general secretion pathway protein E [Synechococcus sp. 65AY6A5]PIK96062.1 general secretion pathway protein E [Synechococcus sp. 60AY4M2]PIK98302.1 general secretion pathway protein E [Synechococcus sp. 63AY4M1]PIL00972.1 general secretion pathway protein E [Synechococcus sp. 65AY640]
MNDLPTPLTRRSVAASKALAIANVSITPFGRKLKELGFADDKQIQDIQNALKADREGGSKALALVVKEIVGKEITPDLERAYKRQQLFELKIIYGIPPLDIDLEPVEISEMIGLIDSLLPLDICNRYKFLPIRRQDNQVLVAMVRPDNLQALDDIQRRFRIQGLKLQRRVFTQRDFDALINRYMDAQAELLAIKGINDAAAAQQEEEEEVVVNTAEIDLDAIEDVAADEAGEGSLEQQVKSADDAPIIKLSNQILVKALQDGASDIHIEPQEEYLRIRFRKDGVLRQAFENFPKKIVPALTARFKIMSNLNIAERRMPQDGRIRRVFKGRKVDFRVSTLPSRYGEKIVLRILDNSATQLGLDKLITDPETLASFKEVVRRPFGLILVTGPTGSGKTTTLYSALAEVNDPGINISTAEDPIEYSLPGITQVQVIREKGMDFAMILRAFLRQDPDVILVGETRDHETAKTAIEASLTGHLVLTTLHTNDAPGAIARLTEMGIEPFMISSSLLGVLAQRLMRRVCTECRIPYHPTSEELARYGLSLSGDGEQLTFYKANKLSPKEIEQRKATGKPICEKCGGVGYKGRVGVYEFMRMNDRLAELINKGAPTEVIKEAAVESGMKTLLAYSLMLVKQGLTTLEEVDRVILTDKGLETELKARAKALSTCRNCGAALQVDWMDCPYCLTPKF